MRLADQLSCSGDWLFRHRSHLPIVFLPLLVALSSRAGYPFGSHALDLAWEVTCFLISAAGLAIRVVTVGTAPHGTSGRNTGAQKARVLNTTGPYSIVRHPLYLGNYVIALGISSAPRTWYLPVIVSLSALLYYERIAMREEQFLQEKFGDEFHAWAARVPAIIPTFRLYRPPAVRFSWRRAIRGEFYGVLTITGSFFAMDVTQEVAMTGRLAIEPLWGGVFVVGAALFIVLRTMKKRGRLADPGGGG
jgi:protein-S-isoprenylcysteine O-methyltransferase Ste14